MDIKNITNRKKIIGIWTFFFITLFFTAAMLIAPASETNVMASSTASQAPASFSELVKKASPSVVNISSVTVIKAGRSYQQMPQNPFGDDPFGDFFDYFFRDQIPQMPRDYRQTGLGTGFIIDKDGHILTNNHMVEGADEIKVTLADKREFNAEIIGRDSKTDLALIKIEGAKDLEPLPLGDSDKLEVGDWVVAIGNPYGLANTVTAGIVSAKYRDLQFGSYDNYIQTDASINRGNSGGPLMNTKGEVIGINSAIYSQTGGSIGIGFAIPINMAKDLLPMLMEGKVVRGWLGVMIQGITNDLMNALNLKDNKGALVSDVTAGGPAEKAGFRRGDVIVRFDGKDINEYGDLPYLVSTTPVGKTVDVEVLREGKKMTMQVELGELPEEEESTIAGPSGREAPGPDLGLSVQELTPELARRYGLSDTMGIIVSRVDSNSAASEAGFERGDIILEVNQEQIKDVEQFNQKIQGYKADDTILFLVKREGSSFYITLNVWE